MIYQEQQYFSLLLHAETPSGCIGKYCQNLDLESNMT